MTIAILNNAKRLNAEYIAYISWECDGALSTARTFSEAGMTSYATAAYANVRKLKKRIAKAVEMQKRTKEEIATHFRKERIQRKFIKVFGMAPAQPMATTLEQELMLDQLLHEQSAELALAIAE